MLRDTDSSGGTTQGSTARPGGQEAARHAGNAGEASRAALANGPEKRDTTTHPGNGDSVVPPLLSVTRDTCRILLDAAALADDREKHIRRKCSEGCRACALQRELHEAQRAAALGANAAMRLHWLCDADVLSRYVTVEKRPPKGSEWKEIDPDRILSVIAPGLAASGVKLTNSNGNLYTYPIVRQLAPELSSNIAATLSREVERKWHQIRWKALVLQTCSPPHYRSTMPVPIPAATAKLWHVEGDHYAVFFALRAGRGKGWTMPVVARDAYMRRVLTDLCSDRTKMGALKIQEDRLRPGRWYLRIAYTKLVPPVSTSKIRCVVHPGIVCFLYALGTDGRKWVYDGRGIEAQLKQIQSRRKSYQYDSKASSRCGHGRKRKLRPIEHVKGAGDRWRATKVQTVARRLARWIVERGYSLVYLPDFSGIRDGLPEKLEGGKAVWDRIQEWPWYAEQQALTACLEEAGVTVEKVVARGSAMTCRMCGHREKANIVLSKRQFACKECGHREFLDAHTSANLLARAIKGEQPGGEETAGIARSTQTKGGGDAERSRDGAPGSGGEGTARKPARKRSRSRRSDGTGGNGKTNG